MKKLPYQIALNVASRLRQRMLPHCQQVEIAGSVRREKKFVSDIEIVAVPVLSLHTVRLTQGNFFGSDTKAIRRSELVDNVINPLPNTSWIKPGFKDYKKAIETHGKNVLKEVPELKLDLYNELSQGNEFGKNRKHWKGLTWIKDQPVILDIFIADPDNFGVIYLIRTGSKEFNIRMLDQLKKHGYTFDDGRLKHFKGKEVDDFMFDNVEFCPDERYIFQKAGMAFVPPEKRNN